MSGMKTFVFLAVWQQYHSSFHSFRQRPEALGHFRALPRWPASGLTWLKRLLGWHPILQASSFPHVGTQAGLPECCWQMSAESSPRQPLRHFRRWKQQDTDPGKDAVIKLEVCIFRLRSSPPVRKWLYQTGSGTLAFICHYFSSSSPSLSVLI